MGETAPTNRDAVRAAAANAIAPDPQTRAILEKYDAGQPLTPQESGKLGWWRGTINKLNRKISGDPEPGQPGTPGRHPSAVATVATSQAQTDSLAAVEVDAGLAMRTASALLDRGDAFAVALVERHAREAGANGETLNRFVTAAGLSPRDKKLIVELSPDVCAELGIDPRAFAVWTVLGVLGFHAVNLWQCVGELKEMKRERGSPAPASDDAPKSFGPLPLTARTQVHQAPGTGQPLPAAKLPADAPPGVK